MTKTEVFQGQIKKWVSYWRANPHRFCEEVLNIHLKTFQKILLCEMNDTTRSVLITSRGLGKTYLTALFSVVRCILYPGTSVVVASKTRKQANEIIKKVKEIFMPNSPILQGEIESILLNQYNSTISFKNSSLITVVTASETSRGTRCNILILDEFRMIDQNICNTVLKKFLNVNRQPEYLKNPEYAGMTEENKEFYLSSAWFSDNWSYDMFKTTFAQMVSGNYPYFCCALPYQIAVKENLLTRERVLTELTDPSFNSVTWQMEMEALFYTGAADGCLYEYGEINPCRKIKYAFLPPHLSSLVNDKRLKIPPKMHNEVRILSADIALMASTKGNNNDATSIFINQLLLNDNGKSINNIIYGQNNEGLRTEEQALIIRKLYDQYSCDALVIDTRGIGVGVVDQLLADMYDPDTGIVYGALSSPNPDIAARCRVRNAPKVIYPILATADFNSRCALGLRESIKQGTIRLLIDEEEFEENANDIVGWSKLSVEDRMAVKLPYINTTLLVNELVSLQYENKNGLVRVKERSNMRKDRYSSLSYSIEIGKQIEKDYMNQASKKTMQDLVLLFRKPQY